MGISRGAAVLGAGVGVIVTLVACTAPDGPSAGPSATSPPVASGPVAGSASPAAARSSAVATLPARAAAHVLRPAASGSALGVLAALPVKGRAPRTGYARARFGRTWTDDTSAAGGHNGCDTRDDVLGAQLQHAVLLDGCRVASGDETDPYTGADLYYVRGHSTVDVDHVVSLGDAWQKGAQQLTADQRRALANDPQNLLAVSSRANRQKGDGDAATWLPRVRGYRCAYVARQIAVKYRYRLWVTAAERDAMRRVLATCPDESVPTGEAPRAQAAAARPAPRPSRTRTRTSTPPAPVHAASPAADCTPGYSPCVPVASDVDCAGGSGNGPVYVQGPITVTGDDPYGLDSDHDGIGCEN